MDAKHHSNLNEISEESSQAVQLATRSDLFSILSFLDDRLHLCCEVHSLVQSMLLTLNPVYNVYFLLDPSSRSSTKGQRSNYLAIVGAKREDAISTDKVIWMLMSWSAHEKALFKVYESIKVIDWKRDAVFAFNDNYEASVQTVQFFHEKRATSKPEIFAVNRYSMDTSDAFKIQINFPEEVYVKSLERCHAKIVYDHWPQNNTSSVGDVADEIDQLPSTGCFLKDGGDLVCWAMFHPGFGMSRLYTLDNYRRRGYATVVLQYLAKQVAQSGYVPYAGAKIENIVSNKFFQDFQGLHFLKPTHALLSLASST